MPSPSPLSRQRHNNAVDAPSPNPPVPHHDDATMPSMRPCPRPHPYHRSGPLNCERREQRFQTNTKMA
ncbi:hypothetical protein OG21DRAFT_1508863 [Imleria badia]|nr:hypothetical protein OG21DRAFT_1508863 [Imleria badia]